MDWFSEKLVLMNLFRLLGNLMMKSEVLATFAEQRFLRTNGNSDSISYALQILT